MANGWFSRKASCRRFGSLRAGLRFSGRFNNSQRTPLTRLQQSDFVSIATARGYVGPISAWHHAPFGIRGVSAFTLLLGFLHARWNRYSDGTEDGGGRVRQVAAQQESLPLIFDLRGLQCFQVAEHLRPLELVPLSLQSALQFLAQQQRQKAAEHV